MHINQGLHRDTGSRLTQACWVLHPGPIYDLSIWLVWVRPLFNELQLDCLLEQTPTCLHMDTHCRLVLLYHLYNNALCESKVAT